MPEVIGTAVKVCECNKCDSVVQYTPSEALHEMVESPYGFYHVKFIVCPSCSGRIVLHQTKPLAMIDLI